MLLDTARPLTLTCGGDNDDAEESDLREGESVPDADGNQFFLNGLSY
jgi:hypothetical protein